MDCSEACLSPTIYPQRGTLGICKCIPQQNSLKFSLIHLFPQPLSSGLKKNKKNSPVSASHSSPPPPHTPSAPTPPPVTTFPVFMTPGSSLQPPESRVWPEQTPFSLLKQPLEFWLMNSPSHSTGIPSTRNSSLLSLMPIEASARG